MFVASFQALVVALLAIVPGYITIYFWSRNKLWRGLTNDLQTVLKALALSAVKRVNEYCETQGSQKKSNGIKRGIFEI